MTTFVDRTLLALRDPAALGALLAPVGAAPFDPLTRLIESVFDVGPTVLHEITAASVGEVRPMTAVVPRRRIGATATMRQPSYSLVDVTGHLTEPTTPRWADLMAAVTLRVVTETAGGGVESAVTHALENITSLEDFHSRFRYLDLDGFLTANSITTVEELRDSHEYLLTEVRLRPPPSFDHADPANTHDVDLDVAIVISETLDLAAGLRAANTLRAAAAGGPAGPSHHLLGPTVAPFAVAVVFPRDALVAGAPTAKMIDDLYAAAGVLPLFSSPP